MAVIDTTLTAKRSTNVRSEPRSLRRIRTAFKVAELLWPAAAAAAAERTFRTPRRYPAPSAERMLLAQGVPFSLRVDGRWLAAWSWGSGPPALLVHGWEGRAGQMGPLGGALAAAGLRAVAFDAPAHGASAGRRSSLPELAAAIVGAGRELGPLEVVVAHSFGTAGTALAVALGLRAQRMAFIAPFADGDRYLRAFGRLLELGDATIERMVRRIERRFGIPWSQLRAVTVDASRIAPELPLLVVHDEDDAEAPAEDGRRIAAAWPNGRLDLTRGLGHRRILRDPGVIARVSAFAAGAAEPAAAR